MERLKPYTHHSLRGLWVWGASGTGKDYFIREVCRRKNLSIFEKDRTRWFTGYRGEKIIYQGNVEADDVKYLSHIWKKLG